MGMSREEAIVVLKNEQPHCGKKALFPEEKKYEAFDMAIKALEILEEFEKAQIITGGRLNGRTYAYKCGLEDGKRKALREEPCEDEYIKVPKEALKYRTAGMVAYNAEWLKNHFDMERAVICGAQEPCDDCVRRKEVLDILKDKWGMFSDANDAMQESIDTIEALKPVTPKPETVTDFADRCHECGAKYGKLLEQEETHNIIEKGVLKQRGEGYVYYDINWLKKWWRPEMELLGINTWE